MLVKNSRTLTLSLFEAVYGAMIAVAPDAIGIIMGVSVLPPDAPAVAKIAYYGTIAVGMSKVALAGLHAYLRFDTHGSVGES